MMGIEAMRCNGPDEVDLIDAGLYAAFASEQGCNPLIATAYWRKEW